MIYLCREGPGNEPTEHVAQDEFREQSSLLKRFPRASRRALLSLPTWKRKNPSSYRGFTLSSIIAKTIEEVTLKSMYCISSNRTHGFYFFRHS